MPTSSKVKNLNLLNPLGFEFVLARSPNLVWFIQGVNVPGVSLGDSSQSYSTGKASIPGDDLEYNELSLTFLVDESLNSWREMYNWMRGIAPTQIGDDNQYETLKKSDFGVVSDATLIIHTNSSNPNIKFEFKDVYPLSLSDIDLSVVGSEVEPIQSTISFRYTRYDILTVADQEGSAVEGNIL